MADSKIQIEVEVIGADKATTQLEKVEKQSINIKEGVNGVGESFKSVGDLVTSQGGVMGEAFGTLGDSVIAVTDSILVFKDGMATAGATGAKAWLGLLGPIAMVVSAVALAVDAYRQLSGSMLEAEENAENMAAAASDTASRLEAMVENGIILSTNALKEFITINEKARLKIEQTIKANEKRATSELKVKEAREALNKAENSWFLSSARQLKAQYDLSKAEEEYNKLLENQIKLQNDASKAQDDSYKLEQLLANDLGFFIDELSSQVDTYADLEGQLVKTTNATNAEASATLVSATTKKKYYEEINRAKELQKVYDIQLEKGIINQKTYDIITKANKKSLQERTDALKEENSQLGIKVKLSQADADILKVSTDLTKKNNTVVSSGISLAERRIANYENINRIEKEYLANLSNELKIETILKEVVIGGSDAVVKKRNKEIEQISNLIELRQNEFQEYKKIQEDEIKIAEETLKRESKGYENRIKEYEDITDIFKGSNEQRFKDFQDLIQKDLEGLKYEFSSLKDEVPRLLKDIEDSKKKTILSIIPSLTEVYKEYYKNLADIAKVAYDVEMKDLNEQEFKLKQSKKKNKDELLNIEKKKVLAEQNFIADQSKIQLQLEQDINNAFIKIEMDRLNKSLEINKETLDKQLIDLDLSNTKREQSIKNSFDKQIQDYKKARSPFLSLFIDENNYITKFTDDFNRNLELKTLETEKAKIEIETKSQEDRLKKLKEFTDETGKINEIIRNQTQMVFKIPELKLAQEAFDKAKQERDKVAELIKIPENLSDFVEWVGNRPYAETFYLMEATSEELEKIVGKKGVDEINKYRKEWENVNKTFDDTANKLEELTGEYVAQGYYARFDESVYGIPEESIKELAKLREKYKIDPTQNIEDQLNILREGYQTEVEALQISLEQKKLLIDDYNMKINKSNEEKANKDIETSKMEYSTVRGMLYDMTDAYAQSASANIATAFYQGESIKEALKSTLQSLAIESTSKAIYETAAGFASLAIPGMQTSSALHFKAAAMYGSVALLSGIGTKLAPPSGGGGATAPTTPTGNTQGISQTRSAEDKGQVQNFYINFGGAVIYDTKKSAEMAMADRIMQLGLSSRRGFNLPIDNRNGR